MANALLPKRMLSSRFARETLSNKTDLLLPTHRKLAERTRQTLVDLASDGGHLLVRKQFVRRVPRDGVELFGERLDLLLDRREHRLQHGRVAVHFERLPRQQLPERGVEPRLDLGVGFVGLFIQVGEFADKRLYFAGAPVALHDGLVQQDGGLPAVRLADGLPEQVREFRLGVDGRLDGLARRVLLVPVELAARRRDGLRDLAASEVVYRHERALGLDGGGADGLALVRREAELVQRRLHGLRIDGLRGACRRAGQKDVKLPDEGLGRFRLHVVLDISRLFLRSDADSTVVRDRLVAGDADVAPQLRRSLQMQCRVVADCVKVRVSAHCCSSCRACGSDRSWVLGPES